VSFGTLKPTAGDLSVRSTIESLKGQTFTLYLPMKDVNGRALGYTFVFKIADVACVSCQGVTKKVKPKNWWHNIKKDKITTPCKPQA
jgi:hypothetical protein